MARDSCLTYEKNHPEDSTELHRLISWKLAQ